MLKSSIRSYLPFKNECEPNLTNVHMLYTFFKVYCEVEPKCCALAQTNAELAAAIEKLEAVRKKLLVSTALLITILL